VAQEVQALRYNPEDGRIDSQWGHCIFHLLNPSGRPVVSIIPFIKKMHNKPIQLWQEKRRSASILSVNQLRCLCLQESVELDIQPHVPAAFTLGHT
jgi:hypothetical protein